MAALVLFTALPSAYIYRVCTVECLVCSNQSWIWVHLTAKVLYSRSSSKSTSVNIWHGSTAYCNRRCWVGVAICLPCCLLSAGDTLSLSWLDRCVCHRSLIQWQAGDRPATLFNEPWPDTPVGCLKRLMLVVLNPKLNYLKNITTFISLYIRSLLNNIFVVEKSH